MSNLIAADPLALVAIEAGLVGAPLADAAAQGSSKLDSQQRSIEIGEPVPIVFCRRDEVAGTGGVLISPGASEARFENDASNNVTAYYHLVLSEGQIDSIQVRDVFQRSCRVGSHTQTYNRRAGTWSPGNAIVAREGYDMPECPYYCGSVGTYTGMSTLSFEVTIPNGFDYWNRQVHCFIRGGMRVTRLVDSVSGPSNNYADLVNWCLANSSKIPSSLIDTTALTTTANFLATNTFNCDIAITESTNLPDLLGKLSPYFLVTETRNLGKRGLRPLLPITAGHEIDTTEIAWEYTFTEDHILPGSFQISYTPLADRKPFCAQMIWRQQLTDDFGIIRTSEVRYAGTAENGPFEQHDMSAFCTVENHAVKAGAYILARRRYITHTLRFSCRPGAFNTTLVPGDIVRVTLSRAASSAAATSHDYLYELNRITKTLKGDLTLELTHFPVDSQGRSLVALDVAATTGTGILLTSNKTGVGCDINSSSDQTVPAEAYTDGTAADSQIVVAGYSEATPGNQTANTDDNYDTGSWPGPGISGTPAAGETLTAPTICEGGITRWWKYDPDTNQRIGNYLTTGQTIALGDDLVGYGVGAETICPGNEQGYFSPVVGPVEDRPWLAYSFVRVKWNYWGLGQAVPTTYQTSGWYNCDQIQYIIAEGNPSSSSLLSAKSGGAWQINIKVYRAGTFGGEPSSISLGYVNRSGNWVSVGGINSVYLPNNSPAPGVLVAEMKGYFEFSNDYSTIVRTWSGYPQT